MPLAPSLTAEGVQVSAFGTGRAIVAAGWSRGMGDAHDFVNKNSVEIVKVLLHLGRLSTRTVILDRTLLLNSVRPYSVTKREGRTHSDVLMMEE